jgi:hypothetical protein
LQAERIVGDAHNRARTIIHEAEFYIDNKLGQFEIALDRLLRNVQSIREKFNEQMAPTSLVGTEANPSVLEHFPENRYHQSQQGTEFAPPPGMVFDQDAE